MVWGGGNETSRLLFSQFCHNFAWNDQIFPNISSARYMTTCIQSWYWAATKNAYNICPNHKNPHNKFKINPSDGSSDFYVKNVLYHSIQWLSQETGSWYWTATKFTDNVWPRDNCNKKNSKEADGHGDSSTQPTCDHQCFVVYHFFTQNIMVDLPLHFWR